VGVYNSLKNLSREDYRAVNSLSLEFAIEPPEDPQLSPTWQLPRDSGPKRALKKWRRTMLQFKLCGKANGELQYVPF
jgi:hypothetical protein